MPIAASIRTRRVCGSVWGWRSRGVRSLGRLVSTEFLKLKRTLALRLAFLIPVALTVFVVGGAYARSSATPTKDSLIGFAQLTLTLWSIVVLPFYIALTAALVA